jgi:aspartyl-tRNA(Asn)/glutamyl-tRNA(Gln) amidotransferase subunit A
MEAQRERRQMLAELRPVWQRYNALVTPTAPAPAPELGRWRTVNFWQKASFTTPWNVLAGPALSQCMGFSIAGLPLGLQIAGRPFDDATVLRIGHAYEQATGWRDRRPALRPGAVPPPLPSVPEPVSDLAADGRAAVAQACRRAGLTLTDRQFEMACVAAPYVEAMTLRLRRPRAFGDEPASTFQCSP